MRRTDGASDLLSARLRHIRGTLGRPPLIHVMQGDTRSSIAGNLQMERGCYDSRKSQSGEEDQRAAGVFRRDCVGRVWGVRGKS